MAGPTVFESLRVWHDARRLNKRIYDVTGSGPFSHDYGLRDQLRRATISVMSNIAEGYERGGDRELAQYLRVAKGSAGEVRSQLYAAEDVGYLHPSVAFELRGAASAIAKQLATLLRSLSRAASHRDPNP